MIFLTVNYNPPFKDYTKLSREKIELEEGSTLKTLIDFLKNRYGERIYEFIYDEKELDGFFERLSIVINGNTYRGDNYLATPLKQDDNIWFAHSFFGG